MERAQLATEAAALTLAIGHGVPAPRVIAADLGGDVEGTPLLLSSFLPGSSRIPSAATPGRLRALGAAAGRLHTIALQPGPELPLRTEPIAGSDFTAQRAGGRSRLLQAAEERRNTIAAPVPGGGTVLVHGDLWQGNMMWRGEECVGMVDWDYAGAGDPGLDLGSIRLDAVLMFGLPAATDVLDGWKRETGRHADAVAYWDLTAALSTPVDMAEWVPVIHDQGRTDLDAQTLNHRRDSFLRHALDHT